jgi:hypothetical protein
LHAWFNREVPRCLRSLKLFDAEGLFLGDASYHFEFVSVYDLGSQIFSTSKFSLTFWLTTQRHLLAKTGNTAEELLL